MGPWHLAMVANGLARLQSSCLAHLVAGAWVVQAYCRLSTLGVSQKTHHSRRETTPRWTATQWFFLFLFSPVNWVLGIKAAIVLWFFQLDQATPTTSSVGDERFFALLAAEICRKIGDFESKSPLGRWVVRGSLSQGPPQGGVKSGVPHKT